MRNGVEAKKKEREREGKKVWEIPPDQNPAFKTAVLFFTHV